MKINRSTISLLLIVILIWAGIIYTIYQHIGDHTDAKVVVLKKTGSSSRDTFQLLLDYPDPFNINFAVKEVIQKKEVKPMPKLAIPVSHVIKPIIQFKYLGLIETKGTKTKTILLLINGEEQFLQIGSLCGGYKIVAATETELVMTNGKEKINLLRE